MSSACGKSGRYLDSLSSSDSFPASASCASAVRVKTLPIEPRLKRVIGVFGKCFARLASPQARTSTGFPPRASNTTPAKESAWARASRCCVIRAMASASESGGSALIAARGPPPGPPPASSRMPRIRCGDAGSASMSTSTSSPSRVRARTCMDASSMSTTSNGVSAPVRSSMLRRRCNRSSIPTALGAMCSVKKRLAAASSPCCCTNHACTWLDNSPCGHTTSARASGAPIDSSASTTHLLKKRMRSPNPEGCKGTTS